MMGGQVMRRPQSLLTALRVWLIVARCAFLQNTVDRLRAKGATMTMRISEQIRDEVLSWPDATEAPHRFGGTEFRLGKRELGHLHGDHLADLPFPVRVREELVHDGRAMPHHILPDSGWVSYPIRDAAAVPGAMALFRLAYDRAVAARDRTGGAKDDAPTSDVPRPTLMKA